MVKSKVSLMIILAICVVMGSFLLASAGEKPLLLNPTTSKAEVVPTHVEGEVPLVQSGESNTDDPALLQAEQDKLNNVVDKVHAPFMTREGMSVLGTRLTSNKPSASKTTLFEDDFSSYAPTNPEDPFPAPWTRIVSNVDFLTWFIGTPSAGGTQSALVPYGYAGDIQDEWLVTPQIDASSVAGGLFVDFIYLQNNDTYPFDLDLYVSTTGMSTGDFTLLWKAMDQTHTNMEWTNATVDLSAYAGETIYLAWRYTGEDTDLGGIDNVVVYDETVLPGRCCYGDPTAPSCADMLPADCQALSDFISFAPGLSCTDRPLPDTESGSLLFWRPLHSFLRGRIRI